MSDLEMKLDTIYFDYILEGKKIYETRVYDEKRQTIKLKDVVLFKDSGNPTTIFPILFSLIISLIISSTFSLEELLIVLNGFAIICIISEIANPILLSP